MCVFSKKRIALMPNYLFDLHFASFEMLHKLLIIEITNDFQSRLI